MPDRRSRFRGCLLAGAVGDALGADVEFWTHREIVGRFGAGGPSVLGSAYGVSGAITDDTQMTLWTAEALLEGGDLEAEARGAYLRWLDTQDESPDPARHAASRLWHVPALHARRAPGLTCLSVLRDRRAGRTGPLNASKGCGGVMRVAPAGLWADSAAAAFEVGCALAAVTHSHPTGVVAAGAFAVAVWHLAEGAALEDALGHAGAASGAGGGAETAAALQAARDLAGSALEDADAVHALATATPDRGPGWVAEEALAVAALCARRHPTDLEAALRMAVTHTGDSDSTGAICGNLMGAALGLEVVPSRWAEAVELRELVLEVANSLYDARESRGNRPGA